MSLVQLRPEAPFAGIAHPVERHLAKVEVASSSLVARSKNSYAGLIARITYIRRHSQVVRQRTANPRFPSSNLGGASNKKPALVAGFLLEMSLPMLDWLSDGPLCGPSPRRGFKSGWRLQKSASFERSLPIFTSSLFTIHSSLNYGPIFGK